MRFAALLGRHETALRFAAVALSLGALIVLARALPVGAALPWLEECLGALGVWAPLVYALVYVFAVMLLLPGWPFTVGAGAMFGVLPGAIIISAASTAAVAAGFLVGRNWLRARLERGAGRDARLSAIDAAVAESGWKVVVLLRLSPVVPFGLQNYVYGATAIGLGTCVLASWIAMLPGTLFYTYAGHLGSVAVGSWAHRGWEMGRAHWAWSLLGLSAFAAALIYVTRLARRRLREAGARAGKPAQVQSGSGLPATLLLLGAALCLWLVAVCAWSAAPG